MRIKIHLYTQTDSKTPDSPQKKNVFLTFGTNRFIFVSCFFALTGL